MFDEFAGVAYSAGWSATRFLPEFLAYRSFSLLADQSWLAQGKAITQYERNLARVCPGLTRVEMRELSRKGMRSYMRYWCDTFRLQDWSRTRIVDTVLIEGEENLRAALSDGGAIAALPHSGNWDHAGACIALKGIRVATVAERLKPESLFQQFLEYRQSLGMDVYPLDATVMLPLMRKIKEGSLIALVADRDLSQHGIPVTFFGEQTTMPPGPAALSFQSGRPILPTVVTYTKNGIILRFGSPINPDRKANKSAEIQRMTQMCADYFAAEIVKAPWDWHMFQPLWSADR